MMRRFGPALAAIVTLGALILVTVLAAGSVDSSALGRAVRAAPLPSGSVTLPAPVSCKIRPTAQASDVVVRGACRGHLDGELTCSGDEDAINASLQAPVIGSRHLIISIILPDPAGPGRYADAAIFVQLTRNGGAERWSDRSTPVTLSAAGLFTVDARLVADVATGSPGQIRLTGSMRCSDLTKGVLDDLS